MGRESILRIKAVEVTQRQLVSLVKKFTYLIEDGLRYLGEDCPGKHPPATAIFADSEDGLVVTTLMVVEDDRILIHGIDYFDYVTADLQEFATKHRHWRIDPRKEPRLLLMAPSFSPSLISRCKWLDIPISLFTVQCVKFLGKSRETVPVFTEVAIPPRTRRRESPTTQERLDSIAEPQVRLAAAQLLEEVQHWHRNDIEVLAINYDVVFKVSGKVFGYLWPRRDRFVVYGHELADRWRDITIRPGGDLEPAKKLLRRSYQRLR